jgi:hypothetical protein
MIVLREIQPALGIAMHLFRHLIHTHIAPSLVALKSMSTCVALCDDTKKTAEMIDLALFA